MKAINIVSLVHAQKDLSEHNFQTYMKSFGLNPKMRAGELADIATLIDVLQQHGAETRDFNYFFVGYAIQQISKEFDLLRIGTDFILNIELKLESTVEKVQRQLVQNAHYLRFLNVPIYNFTFVTQTRTLYKLEHEVLREAELSELVGLMQRQNVRTDASIDDLFDPVHYLVSPIEEPSSFMKKGYFLTAQQTTFKTEIIHRALERRVWLGIEGGPGTGKTLLTYDIAQEYQAAGADVLIVQCSALQEGQIELNRRYGWRIVDVAHCDFEELACDVLIIDEAHHLTYAQLEALLAFEDRHQPKVIMSYDPQHYFGGADIIHLIESHVKLVRFELKVIIRYNKEIHTFINCLFDMYYPTDYTQFKHISIQYFSELDDAKYYMRSLQEERWKVIDVSARFRIEDVHETGDVIGQEFDHVAAVIDEHFYYKTNLRLSCYGIEYTHEQPTKVLFQALTRTRKKLQLVIVNNEQVLENVMAILYSVGDYAK